MPLRKDTLPKPADAVGVRLDLDPRTHEAIRMIAAGHGYVMSSLLRLLAEQLAADPKYHLKRIPKNPR